MRNQQDKLEERKGGDKEWDSEPEVTSIAFAALDKESQSQRNICTIIASVMEIMYSWASGVFDLCTFHK